MKTEFIRNFLTGNNIELDRFISHINFDLLSGSFIKNNIYKDSIQFGETNSGFYIFSEYSPAVFTSCYKYSGLSGSGLFDGNNELKLNINNALSHESIFLNYVNNIENYSGSSIKGKIKTLLDISSEEGLANRFSYSVGLTDRNDLSINFSGTRSGVTEIHKGFIYDNPSQNNIISFNIKPNKISLYQHDIGANTFKDYTVELGQDYEHIYKDIYIGNKARFKSNIFTGFSGVLKDVILISQNLNEDQLLRLAKIVAQTGEYHSSILKTANPYILYYSGIVNPTGIIGSGITGYEQVVRETIQVECGVEDKNCDIYTLSGVTGYITGYKIEYATGQEYADNYNQSQTLPKYDFSIISNYSNYDINSLLLNNNSIFEIQTYPFQLNLDIISGAKIDYIPNNLTRIFYNGKITRDFIYNNNSIEISGAININSGVTSILNINTESLYLSGYSINSMVPDINIDLSKINNFSLFLEGFKLIENKDYFINSNRLYFNNPIIDKRLLIIQDPYKYRFTGDKNNFNYDFDIISNQHLLWIDGILKYEGIDYGYNRYNLNGGFFNSIKSNNIKIISK